MLFGILNIERLPLKLCSSSSMVLSNLATAATTSSAPIGLLESAAANPHLIGATWMVSSAIFTTYATTAFLKYEVPTGGRGVAAARNHIHFRRFRNINQQQQLQPRQTPSSKTTSLSRPSLLTLQRFGGSLLMGLLFHPNLQILQRVQDTIKYVPSFALPAVFLFTANFMNSVSLSRLGISLTYTTKCAIPILTALLTVLVDGVSALPNNLALCALLPIAAGIAAASWKSPDVDRLGLFAALISTTAQSALGISSKRAMKVARISGQSAQRVMVAVGFVITCAMMLGEKTLAESDADNSPTQQQRSILPPAWLSMAAVAAYHVEYVLGFMFVSLTSPVTFGTCDAMRRLAVILSGRAMFGGAPLTKTNKFGIGLALAGAGIYSIATSM